METWVLALWGFLGGSIIEEINIYRYAKRGRIPKAYNTWAFRCAMVLRLAAGGILAIAFGTTQQVTGMVGLLAVGAATPLIMEKIVKDVPTDTQQARQ